MTGNKSRGFLAKQLLRFAFDNKLTISIISVRKIVLTWKEQMETIQSKYMLKCVIVIFVTDSSLRKEKILKRKQSNPTVNVVIEVWYCQMSLKCAEFHQIQLG